MTDQFHPGLRRKRRHCRLCGRKIDRALMIEGFCPGCWMFEHRIPIVQPSDEGHGFYTIGPSTEDSTDGSTGVG